jgi:hypothetical protein
MGVVSTFSFIIHTNMTKIACQDMGIDGCAFVAEGETFEAAAASLKEHGAANHAEALQASGMTEEAMVEKMKAVAQES